MARNNSGNLLLGLAQGVMSGVQSRREEENQLANQIMGMMLKAQIEGEIQKQRTSDFANMFKSGQNGLDTGKMTFNSDGGISVTPYTKKELRDEDIAGRASKLARAISSVEQIASRGITKPNLLLRGSEKIFPTSEEQSKLIDAISRGKKSSKPSSAQEKRNVEITEVGNQAQQLIDLFSVAQKEGKQIDPNFGKPGYEGRIAGMITSAKGGLGYADNINVYNAKRKAFATTVAKAAGEQRPTDKDIERFMSTLPDVNKNDNENALLTQQLIDDMKSKGFKKMWQERKTTSVKVKDVYNKTNSVNTYGLDPSVWEEVK